jgi:hypothetical protein
LKRRALELVHNLLTSINDQGIDAVDIFTDIPFRMYAAPKIAYACVTCHDRKVGTELDRTGPS